MAMQRVAELVRRASKDTGVIAALRNDPSQLPKSLDLSEEHINALQSASAFVVPSAAPKPAAKGLSFGQRAMATTPAPAALLPPEGTGGGPAVLTLPPMAPVAAPVAPIPAPVAPIGAPVAPVVAPVAKPPVTPPAPVSKPPTASPKPPVTVTPPPVTAPVMAPSAPVVAPFAPVYSPPPQGRTYDPPQPVQTLVAAVAGCECDCSVAITAIVSSVSMTANTALTALTAMASFE